MPGHLQGQWYWISAWFGYCKDWFGHCNDTGSFKRLPPLVTRFMGPTRSPSGDDKTQVGPMLAPWTLLSGTEQTQQQNMYFHIENVIEVPGFRSNELLPGNKKYVRNTVLFISKDFKLCTVSVLGLFCFKWCRKPPQFLTTGAVFIRHVIH